MRITIGLKILLGYGIAMLFMVVAGLTTYRATENLLDSNDWVRHTFLVIAAAEDIRAALLGIESASRGYLLLADERDLQGVEQVRTRLAATQKQLRTLTVDNSVQQSRLDVVEPAIERRIAELREFLDIRKQKGLVATILAVQPDSAGQSTAAILNQMSAIENEEHVLLDRREQTAQRDAAGENRLIQYLTLIGVGLTLLIAILTYRSIIHPLSGFQRFVTAVGDGDLTQKSLLEGKDELGRLSQGLNQMVSRLRELATQTRSATQYLDAAAMEILASAREQSAVTGEQAAAYQETNVTIQQVSQSGLQIAERAKQVTVTAEAVSIANTSGLDAVQKANQTVEAIHEQAEAVAQNIVALSEKTQMVGDILATVNDIAEQSHLLALNAAIEAAAAGEHGRTFSVVAGEIKNLADQSKAATVQVKTILGDIQKEINTSVMLTEEAVKRVDIGKHQADVAASAIRDMAANIDQSVQAFQQIVAGTNQQQIGFDNVQQALKDMSRASEQAATSNRSTEKAAANLTTIGDQLRSATEGYRL